MSCQIFFLAQVKRCAIITYKHGIYELSHQLLVWDVLWVIAGCVAMNFEINLFFLFKPFFLHEQKVKKEKRKYIENKKSFLDKIKSILYHFKGLSMKKIAQFFGKLESNFGKLESKSNELPPGIRLKWAF